MTTPEDLKAAEVPDGYAVIRGRKQKIISVYKTHWEADYYGRSTLPLRGWATYKVVPVKLVFLEQPITLPEDL